MKLSLGTVQFGMNYGISNKAGKVSKIEAKSMLDSAFSAGINLLDTAMSYGNSEKYIGELGTQKFNIITKLPPCPLDCVNVDDWIIEQLKNSLKTQKRNSIYGLLLHKPSQLLETRGRDIYHSMEKVKKLGLVYKIGISIYSPKELDYILDQYLLDIVQCPFNLVDRRLYTSGWMDRLKELGIEIHTRSPFLQGLLLMSHKDMNAKFPIWSEIWDKWHVWLKNSDVSAIQACLSFPLSFRNVDRVVFGANSLIELNEIILASKIKTEFNFPQISCEEETLINPSNWLTN